MTIRTASIRDLNKLPKSTYKVLVTRYYPFYIKGIKGLIDEWIPDLAPSKGLLQDYKAELKRVVNTDMDKRKAIGTAWKIVNYEFRYRRDMLRGDKSMAEVRRLARKSMEMNGKRVVYLICYEKEDDYCHRRLLKDLIEFAIARGWHK